MTNPFRIQSENTENAMNTLLIMQMTNPFLSDPTSDLKWKLYSIFLRGRNRSLDVNKIQNSMIKFVKFCLLLIHNAELPSF